MVLAFNRLKVVVEPGGAVALVAALFHGKELESETVIAVASGGNVDPEIMASALSRFG
jgi:threonine dehydratase